jgi:hypothetical protein
MPAKAAWLQRIPEIIETLAAWPVPVIDRATCEKLFCVRRRRAIALLQYFGGYIAGNTVLINRLGLIAKLQQLAETPEVNWERQRKEKLSAELDQLQQHYPARRIIIKSAAEPVCRSVHTLPSGVQLRPHRLTVEFSNARELLAQLYDLAQAAADDFSEFLNLAEGPMCTDIQPAHSAVLDDGGVRSRELPSLGLLGS